MTPRDILDVADTLCTGVKEAEWRSAVSRAYYAAFHTARILLGDCGFDVPRGDHAHSYLWMRLGNSSHPDIMLAGRALNDLRHKRNWADYDLDLEMDQASALGFLQSADTIVQLLEEAAAEITVRTTITDAMKVYERDVLRQVTWHS